MSSAEERVLQALVTGYTLKSHRDLAGQKVYKLHLADGSKIYSVSKAVISKLKRRGFIVSNQKFPAATYILTENGKSLASDLAENALNPVSANRG